MAYRRLKCVGEVAGRTGGHRSWSWSSVGSRRRRVPAVASTLDPLFFTRSASALPVACQTPRQIGPALAWPATRWTLGLGGEARDLNCSCRTRPQNEASRLKCRCEFAGLRRSPHLARRERSERSLSTLPPTTSSIQPTMPQLPLHDGGSPAQSRSKAPLLLLLAVPVLFLLHSPMTSTARPPLHDLARHQSPSAVLPVFKAPRCPKQAKALKPARTFSFDKGYRDAAAQLLSEAVVRPLSRLHRFLSVSILL